MPKKKNTSVWEESDDEDVDATKLTGTELHKYAERGNAKGIAMIIRRGGRGKLKVNLNEQDGNGRTALMIACRNGQSKIVDFLCQAGANCDIKDKEGLAAVHHCVYGVKLNGTGVSSACVRALHKSGAEIDRKTAEGITALHLAVQQQLPDICSALKDCGADVNKFSTEGYNAIHYGVVSTLSKERAIDNIKILMRLGIDVNVKHPETGSTPLHVACRSEMPDVSRFLIASKANVLEQDNDGNTALHVAAIKGSLQCITAVVTGYNINVLGNSGVAFKRTGSGGAKAEAAAVKQVRRDEQLTNQLYPLLNARNDVGDTPLHTACELGFGHIVDHLVYIGADTSVKNNDGKCCFHLCAEIGHVKILEKMIFKEVDTVKTLGVPGTHHAEDVCLFP